MNRDNIYIVILGGVEVSEHGMTWGGGWTFQKAIGGCAVISETARKLYPHHYTSLIAHEFTHAFGIKHNTDNKSLMGTLPYGGPSHILNFEARLLNKHHLFNDSHILNTPPQITSDLTIRNIDADNISLEAQARSGDDLYHCQVHTGQDYVGSDVLHGRSDTIQVKVPRGLILNGRTLDGRDLEFRVYDINGNRGQKSFRNIQLPEPLLENRDITPIDTEGNVTYLTLASDHDNAIVPQNSLSEWDGWLGFLWEKTPEGRTSPKPEWYVDIPSDLLNQWDYWFYLHAISRIVYDIGDRNYTKFDGYFYMPNPCGSTASIELICFADGEEIYNSGVLRGSQARNKHISFDIPENSETFTITVTDAGNDITCDHFLIANAYLAYSDSSSAEYHTDVNGDGSVNIVDLVLVAARYGETITGSSFPNPDVNGDGIVDIDDIILIANELPVSAYSAPSLQPILTDIDLDSVYTTLPSTVADKGIAMLNHLFGAVIPAETRLLPNYPNPFNPETWIPYQLSKPAEVTLTIYAVNGLLIRRLALGYQTTGVYQNKKQSAYWDGKNEAGELVASGVYFYTLTAGDFTTTRKLLLRK